MPEKLMSIKEVAEYLKISEEEVKRLVDIGEIPAYKIGGSFLRFRKEQLDGIRTEIDEIEEATPQPGAGEGAHRAPQQPEAENDYTLVERIGDFFYFNDFYILSFAVIAVLMYLIFR
jgi:excisionase family DNA binding protein